MQGIDPRWLLRHSDSDLDFPETGSRQWMWQTYRHSLQDLFDDVSSVSLTVVASLHDPRNRKTRCLQLNDPVLKRCVGHFSCSSAPGHFYPTETNRLPACDTSAAWFHLVRVKQHTPSSVTCTHSLTPGSAQPGCSHCQSTFADSFLESYFSAVCSLDSCLDCVLSPGLTNTDPSYLTLWWCPCLRFSP